MDHCPSHNSHDIDTSAEREVTPSYKKVVIGNATLYLGDAAVVLPHLSDIDACVADGPYGLSFMGKAWDYDVPKADLWALVFAALKPGSHLVNFASSRTYHRMAVQVEDGGFNILDQMMWLHAQGFPKTRDISRDLDELRGFHREVVGTIRCPGYANAAGRHGKQTQNVREFDERSSEPISDEAKQWQGWGNALKPAHEPIVLAQKPFLKKRPIYQNILDHGVGALNINASRVPGENPSIARRRGASNHLSNRAASETESEGRWVSRQSESAYRTPRAGEELGRWPANILHDGSDEVLAELAENARFFFCAKASTEEREAGLTSKDGNRVNIHPTVKPLALMRRLNKPIAPPGGLILDPFLGSGTTGVAALQNGFRFIGIERDDKSFEIACARIAAAQG